SACASRTTFWSPPPATACSRPRCRASCRKSRRAMPRCTPTSASTARRHLCSPRQPYISSRTEALMTRNILITGASGGLGAAVVEAFQRQGDRVTGASHPDFDLTRPEEAARAVAAAGAPLDALVHLMGGFAGGDPVALTDDATWRRMMTLNLDAAFYACRAAIPSLLERAADQPGGRIILIGSRAAVAPAANLAAYNVSKAGVVALARTLALELAPRATCNVVLPSVIDTPGNR